MRTRRREVGAEITGAVAVMTRRKRRRKKKKM
jgi:hypothetical protein